MTTEATTELLSWNDVIKIVLGFFVSLILIWIGSFVKSFIRKKVLKRSVWNVFKNHESFDDWIHALDEMCGAAKAGNAYAISFDVSQPLSNLITELATLDPLNSDIYYDLLGQEEVVRKGIKKINELQMSLVNSRADGEDWAKTNISTRNMISGQCSALKKDIVAMYGYQLSLMKHIQIKKRDSVDPVGALEIALNKQRQQDA
ncbi:MAG: hypothetical protein MI867_13890 [Pseudomonadales bacterium]|nr:hypothetical protein [Pseudomonadales bacterium]